MTLGSIKAYCRANYLCHLLRREDWSQGGSRATRREKQINPLIKLWSWAQLQQPTFFTICITSVFYGCIIWCVGACVFFIHCVYMLYLFYSRTIAHRANGICCTCTRLRIRFILSFSVLIQFSSKSVSVYDLLMTPSWIWYAHIIDKYIYAHTTLILISVCELYVWLRFVLLYWYYEYRQISNIRRTLVGN